MIRTRLAIALAAAVAAGCTSHARGGGGAATVAAREAYRFGAVVDGSGGVIRYNRLEGGRLGIVFSDNGTPALSDFETITLTAIASLVCRVENAASHQGQRSPTFAATPPSPAWSTCTRT